MFAKISIAYTEEELFTLSEGVLERPVLIDSALKAARLMVNKGIREDGLVYFSLSSEGEPYHFERKIFSACFLCLGCGALSQVLSDTNTTESADFKVTTIKLLNSIISLSKDPSPFARPVCCGAPPTSPLNIPMILMNLIDELRTAHILDDCSENYSAIEEWCVEEIKKHVIVEKKIVLEVVGPNGEIIEGYDGRHMNPGHAIEAGWFVLQYARRTGRADLRALAVNMVEWSFERGWDSEEHGGGILYFLDSEGRSPPYLEWNMKLWWPHCEAMVAYAMLYADSRSPAHWARFEQVAEYTLRHFSDAGEGGEWFGYCDRAGRPTHRFKGGPYKGCFHVPRALFMCANILKDVAQEGAQEGAVAPSVVPSVVPK